MTVGVSVYVHVCGCVHADTFVGVRVCVDGVMGVHAIVYMHTDVDVNMTVGVHVNVCVGCICSCGCG